MVPFIEARWYTPTQGRAVDLAVIHSMEVAEKPTTAEGVARMFATTDRKASAHYCHDDDSTVQCVRERDVAYAAPGANHNGVHFELAGFAAQSAAQWKDAYSSRMLREQAAPMVADVCTRYDIPVVFVDAAGLLAGRRGVTDHDEVSKAFRRSTHWDPGPNFPMQSFLSIVRAMMDQPTQEDDLTPEQAQQLEQVSRRVDAIYKALVVPGTTSPEQTVNLAFARIRNLEDGMDGVADKLGVPFDQVTL